MGPGRKNNGFHQCIYLNKLLCKAFEFKKIMFYYAYLGKAKGLKGT